MSTFQVPGAQIWYEVTGSGPWLFLIAGASGTGESFRPLIHTLSEKMIRRFGAGITSHAQIWLWSGYTFRWVLEKRCLIRSRSKQRIKP